MESSKYQVAVMAQDPSGAQVAFVVSSWKSAKQVQRRIESWQGREQRWHFIGFRRVTKLYELPK
jgi:formylglycine-generating enzyme required for sulfatase activity